MQSRSILHIDMNAFYASVEQHKDPAIRDMPVVVAGDPEKRNGIVLAKSKEAKAAGVRTADALWQARQKCPDLIVVRPDYGSYKRYSELARSIYYEYTDQVEPFGLDEAWLDITGSLGLFGSAMTVAQEISERIKSELGLTVSVGVSWNKVFAKFGSDMDAGDGIVTITTVNYKDVVWSCPVEDLIYVGSATARKLNSSGIFTIGELAQITDVFCRNKFGGSGKFGKILRTFARGEDISPVKTMDPLKSDVDRSIKGIGNSLTAPHDLESEDDARPLVWLLSESVAQRLREQRLRCRTISIGVRSAGDLSGYSRQTTFHMPTCITDDIAHASMDLLKNSQPLDKDHAIRAIHVRATNLVSMDNPLQGDLFDDLDERLHREALELTIDDLRRRFGNKCICRAVELIDDTMAYLDIKSSNTVHPIGYFHS